MRTTFGPDHPCPDCATAVYWWVGGTRDGLARLLEVEHGRPHRCAAAPIPTPAPTATRCPDCRLSVYERDGVRYDEDAGLVRHQCAATQSPATVSPPPARPVHLPPARPPLGGVIV